jgi:hypothetical protein
MPFLVAFGSILLIALVFGPSWWIKYILRKYGVERPDLPGTGGEFGPPSARRGQAHRRQGRDH